MLFVHKIENDLNIYGPGKRTVIWFSGCSIHCKGCINPELWKRDVKCAKSVDEVLSLIKNDGVTLLGGEPLDQEDLEILVNKLKLQNKSIIMFTGYSLNNFDDKQKRISSKCDVVISEPYIEALRDDTLYLRGSLNQIMSFNSKRYSVKDFMKKNSFEIDIDKSSVKSFGRNKNLIKELLGL